MRQFETLAELDRLLQPRDSLPNAVVQRDLLQEQGLPFDRALCSLGRSKPEAYGLSVQEFRFPNLSILGLPSTTWGHHAHRTETEWTQEFTSRFWMLPDRDENFHAVVSRLEETFGSLPPPARSTHWNAAWGDPLLQVRATAFAKGTKAQPNNPRLARFPELMDCTEVAVYTAFRTLHTDPGILERVQNATYLDQPFRAVRAYRAHQHLHPSPFDEDRQGLWIDTDFLGISRSHLSILLPRTRPLSLRLTEITAARGPGSSGISLTVGDRGVSLQSSSDTTGLRSAADRIAAKLDLPIEHVTYAND